MSTLKGTAPCCGDVTFFAEDVTMYLYDVMRPGIDGMGRVGTYYYDCPKCEAEVEKPLTVRVAGLLIYAGVEIEVVPEPLTEAAVTEFANHIDHHLDRLLDR